MKKYGDDIENDIMLGELLNPPVSLEDNKHLENLEKHYKDKTRNRKKNN